MLFTQVPGRKVVSTSTAEVVGQVVSLVVDPRSHSVVAVKVKSSSHGDTLAWADIGAFGADAVTVAGAEALREGDDAVKALSAKDHHLLGKRVLNTIGEDLGTLSEVEFDPTSGAVERLLLPDRAIDGPLLIGVGSYAVIVHAEGTSS